MVLRPVSIPRISAVANVKLIWNKPPTCERRKLLYPIVVPKGLNQHASAFPKACRRQAQIPPSADCRVRFNLVFYGLVRIKHRKLVYEHMGALLVQNNLMGNTDYLIIVLANHEKCVLTATYKYFIFAKNLSFSPSRPWVNLDRTCR